MRFGILGPFEVADDEGRELALGGRKQRSVLAILLLRAGDVVPSDRLIDELWGERPPPTAAKTVQVYVSNLRKALGDGVLVTRAGGYALRATADQLDAREFEALAAEGHAALHAGDPRRAANLLRQALGLWRGPALADFAYDAFAQAEVARLEESRLVVLEDRIDAELALGEHARLVGELEALVREHPLRERPVGQLMLALYRSGRQADALELYRRARDLLRDELGLEPSSELRELERSILNQDATVGAPPHSAPTPAANLPVPATEFVGRRHELADLEALLRRGGTRLLTLTGAGGSGKTRLALRVAETCAAEYRDGTWFVGFADITDPELIAPTISQTLGLAETARLEPLPQLQQWLGERRVLLVLDNLEQLAAGSAVLARVLGACPALTLLVTSREPLHLAGEQQYEVPVLEPEDAATLFDSRARAVVPGLTVDHNLADAICERLDYLPLAIELAAARTKALAPAEILTRLDTRLPLLTGGPRDAPRRQQTLRATLDWSYELLDTEQRRLLTRLAVFAGGCTFEAAETVCGAELDTLQALVDRSLVRTDGRRYWMLPTLREYGLERLEQAGEVRELRRLHKQWFVGLIHSEGLDARASPTPALLGRLSAERENYRGALEWAAESGDHESVARLAHPLTFYWWESQGQLQEARRWVGLALDHLGEYPPNVRVGVLQAARSLAWWLGEHKQALALSEQVRALLPQVGDPYAVFYETIADGHLAGQRGDLDRARAALEDAVRFAREHNLRTLSSALVDLGDLSIEQGRLDEARASLEEALACPEDPTLPPDVVALINLSEIAALQGRYGDAVSLGRTALTVALDHGDQTRAVWAVFHIAWPLAELGELERAGRLVGAATAFLQNAGFARSRSDLLCEKGVLDALHRRLPADTVRTLVEQGHDMPLDEALNDALKEPRPHLSVALRATASPAPRPT